MTGVPRDADELRPLAGHTLAVVGYGNQGRSQALNLRDAGLAVLVGNIADARLGQARRSAFDAPRPRCLEMSFPDEACLDLFTEQAFGPAFGRVMLSAVQTLVDRGYPPEA